MRADTATAGAVLACQAEHLAASVYVVRYAHSQILAESTTQTGRHLLRSPAFAAAASQTTLWAFAPACSPLSSVMTSFQAVRRPRVDCALGKYVRIYSAKGAA